MSGKLEIHFKNIWENEKLILFKIISVNNGSGENVNKGTGFNICPSTVSVVDERLIVVFMNCNNLTSYI